MLSPMQIAAMLMGAFWGEIPATLFFALGAVCALAGSLILLGMSRFERSRQGQSR